MIPEFVALAERPESVNHWVVGTIALVILLSLILALLAFGRGREHS